MSKTYKLLPAPGNLHVLTKLHLLDGVSKYSISKTGQKICQSLYFKGQSGNVVIVGFIWKYFKYL